MQFNEGPNAVSDILKYFGFATGIVMTNSGNKKARQRTRNIERKMSVEGRRRRKTLRSFKKGYSDREKEQEGGESYIAGGF